MLAHDLECNGRVRLQVKEPRRRFFFSPIRGGNHIAIVVAKVAQGCGARLAGFASGGGEEQNRRAPQMSANDSIGEAVEMDIEPQEEADECGH